MKKYICFSIVMFLYTILFSQEIRDSINKGDYEWKFTIEKQDDEERRNADHNPIIKKIYDTLGYDYLEQHFYHNGNLYYQVPYVNGKQNGIYEEYYPNGQLNYKNKWEDGHLIYTCNHLSFDRFGDTSSTSVCIIYKKEDYYCVTHFYFGKPYKLRIYMGKPSNLIFNYNCMVAEFEFDTNKWKKRDYHIRSVKYAKKLLRVYLKNKK
jgi:hypothetical protein